MEIDKDTIAIYLKESIAKVELLKTDIATYEYKIKQSRKEIATMHYLIDQYKKALEIIHESQ